MLLCVFFLLLIWPVPLSVPKGSWMSSHTRSIHPVFPLSIFIPSRFPKSLSGLCVDDIMIRPLTVESSKRQLTGSQRQVRGAFANKIPCSLRMCRRSMDVRGYLQVRVILGLKATATLPERGFSARGSNFAGYLGIPRRAARVLPQRELVNSLFLPRTTTKAPMRRGEFGDIVVQWLKKYATACAHRYDGDSPAPPCHACSTAAGAIVGRSDAAINSLRRNFGSGAITKLKIAPSGMCAHH